MSSSITLLAGARALSAIRDNGLTEDMVRVIAGAAGGPKWLILSRLDRAIFSNWFRKRKNPLYFIGSSIGAWRFAAVSQKDPAGAISRFESAYINQSYSDDPTPEEITAETFKIQKEYIKDTDIRTILDHPVFRMNIMAVRCRRLTGTDNKYVLGFGLALAAALNVVGRNTLKFFFERALFSDPRDIPPFFEMGRFPIRKTPLTEKNFRKALLASGSIPMVMSRVTDIPGAAAGSYRDGGVVDYHLDIPLLKHEGIVLYPHFTDRIIPGWLDKHLSWRKPSPINMDHVLVVAPSNEFIQSLPLKKIPDRNDFYLFKGKDKERFAYWKTVVRENERMAYDFFEAVESGRIRNMVRPLTTSRKKI